MKISSPKSAYLRLIEHQGKMRLQAYRPDYPLVFFITLSRIASGISISSVFFPPSILWTVVAFACMIFATLASIAHLKVPTRFLTMLRNNRSYLVWEIRLAGAFTSILGLQCLSMIGYSSGYQIHFIWANAILAFLFLISTGWAYRFETHPAWNTIILPIYYIISALLVGSILHSMFQPSTVFPVIYPFLLIVMGVLLLLYRTHLQRTSFTSLEEMKRGQERWTFLLFLWFNFIIPGLLALLLLAERRGEMLWIFLASSIFIGIFLERILFFRVERPVFFLSFIKNPDMKSSYWIRG